MYTYTHIEMILYGIYTRSYYVPPKGHPSDLTGHKRCIVSSLVRYTMAPRI